MVSPSLTSLLDLCGVRIAYLMWTRRDLASNCWETEPLNELEHIVLDDIQSLPLPKQVKSRVLKHARPAGERLLSFLNLWLSKLPPKTPQKWLLGNMLFDCLILNADGLINQRKTAQTLLEIRTLHNILAFRLACINFLENEVLKLWILVKEYFLNKVILEGDDSNLYIDKYFPRNKLLKKTSVYLFSGEDSDERSIANPFSFPHTTEPEEVLFWISYCLSKDNEIDIKKIPHFKRTNVDRYTSLIQSAAFCGNVACFDYFKNFCKIKFEYDHVDMIENLFNTAEKECMHPSFVFHFMLLSFEEKAKLFQEFPINMVLQFLQWPLSQTFLENTEEIWNLISNEEKDWIFLAVSEILMNANILLNPFNKYLREFADDYTDMNTAAYCIEHLSGIWIALWNIHSDSYKTTFLNKYVFIDFECSDADSEEDSVEEFPGKFETSRLKRKLLNLFLSRGEALFELFEGENVKESLKNIVAKYRLEDSHDIDHKCISLLKTYFLHFGMLSKVEVKQMAPRVMKQCLNPIDEKFLNCIKQILFSSHRN